MSRWKLFLIAGFLTCMAGTLSARSLTEFLFCGCDLSPCPTAPCRPFSGFFVGVNGGIATNMAETSMFSNLVNEGDLSESFLTENNIYQLRPWGEVFGGWGWQFCWLYLGGRVGANFSRFDPESRLNAQIFEIIAGVPGSIDTYNNTIKTELRITEYTFDFKPGIVFCNNTMLFGIFGAALNKQHMHGKSMYELSGPDVTDPGTAEIEVSRRRSSAGFRGGAGIEHMFCGCLSLNLMYVYTRYWELSDTDSRINPVDQGFTATFSTKAHKQVTSIGLTAYF